MLLTLLLAAAAPAPSSTPAPTTLAAPDSAVAAPEGAGDRVAPLPVGIPKPIGSTRPYSPSERPAIGFISAGSLRDRCQASSPGLVSYCFAYITGVHDSVRAYETWLKFREFCPPFDSSQGDLRRAFLSYLADNPRAASGEAASVVVLAFKDRFSCSDPTQEPVAAKPAAKPATKPTATKPKR
jgi:hypothetical protein